MKTPPTSPTRRTARRATAVAALLATVALLSGCLSADQSADLGLINEARKANRLSALSSDTKAMAKAQAWSQHMAGTGVLEHTGGGTKLDTSGVTGWCSYYENVGYGRSVQAVHDAFMASSAHKANILSKSHRVGTGVYKKGNTYWVTEIFLRNC